MNRSKFSLVKVALAALLVSAGLFLTSCDSLFSGNTDIKGEWVSSWGEKYSITKTDYDNYSHYDSNYNYDADNWYLYYSTTDIKVVKIDDESGYIYGRFDDAEHVGYGAKVDQWYALYYFDLTENSVSFCQAWKENGKSGCDSLKEAKAEYTLDNGYFDKSSASECTK